MENLSRSTMTTHLLACHQRAAVQSQVYNLYSEATLTSSFEDHAGCHINLWFLMSGDLWGDFPANFSLFSGVIISQTEVA